jgi:hypothetical protein
MSDGWQKKGEGRTTQKVTPTENSEGGKVFVRLPESWVSQYIRALLKILRTFIKPMLATVSLTSYVKSQKLWAS